MRIFVVVTATILLLAASCAKKEVVKENPEDQIRRVDKVLLEHKQSKQAEEELKGGDGE